MQTDRSVRQQQSLANNSGFGTEISETPEAEIPSCQEEARCPFLHCTHPLECKTPWHRPCIHAGRGLVRELYRPILLIGAVEALAGTVLLVVVLVWARSYDDLYGTVDSKLISLLTFGGLITIAVTGMLLIISTISDSKSIMSFYIWTSAFLGVYLIILSAMKIHFGFQVLQKEPLKYGTTSVYVITPACLFGLITVFLAVFHIIGNCVVMTYFNMKYILPFNTIQRDVVHKYA